MTSESNNNNSRSRARNYAIMAAVTVAAIAGVAIAVSLSSGRSVQDAAVDELSSTGGAAEEEERLADEQPGGAGEGGDEAAVLRSLPISPEITAAPNPVDAQEPVTVKGRGFGASQEVTLYLGEDVLQTDSQTVTTDQDGNFAAVVDLGSPVQGHHNLTARDEGGNAATVTLIVQ